MERILPQSRAERLVAGGRVVLAVTSLIAIYLDPSEPAKYVRATYTLLSAYCLYSIVVAVAVWRTPVARFKLATHVLDLALFSVLNYLTEGPTSPFFVYFVFALFCAVLRFGWRGTLWTAVVAVGIFFALGIYAGEILQDPHFELNRFIIRSVYLAIVATLLIYLSGYNERLHREVTRLALWPQMPLIESLEEVVETMLAHGQALGAPRIALVWEEEEEPWLYVATRDGDRFETSREPPDLYPRIVTVDSDASFFTRGESIILVTSSGIETREGRVLDEELEKRLGGTTDNILSVAFRGEASRGRVFFFDRRETTLDDVNVAEIATRLIAARLDQYYLSQRVRALAVEAERIRLSQDLHDGALQSLSGIVMQIAPLGRAITNDPAAREKYDQVEEALVNVQRDLRAIVQRLRGYSVKRREDLGSQLAALRDRYQRQWNLKVDLSTRVDDSAIDGELRHAIYSIVSEGIANAARHGSASRVAVRVDLEENVVRIEIDDNGTGFPFHGRYDLNTLAETRRGPATLRERVATLSGNLVIDSKSSGSRLEIELPTRAIS